MTWTYDTIVNSGSLGTFFIYVWDTQITTLDQNTYTSPLVSVEITGNVATAQCLGSHGLGNGDGFTISGAGAPYDGVGWTVTSHTSSTVSWSLTHANDPVHAVSRGTLGWGPFTVVSRTMNDMTDVTFFRDVPTIIREMSFADPFGDAVATLEFPQCTGFDGAGSDTDTWWLRENVNVDICWVPATAVVSDYPVIDPRTNKYGLYLHPENQVPVWEGFTVSIDPSPTSVSMTCQGCLYQLDRYRAKPMYPYRPKTVESMIARYFDPQRRGLFTKALQIEPADMHTYTNTDKNRFKAMGGDHFIPTGLDVNDKWTGYVTRNTGGWEEALTGYVQGQLSFMYAIPEETGKNGTLNVTYAELVNDVVTLTVTGSTANIGNTYVIEVRGVSKFLDGVYEVSGKTSNTISYIKTHTTMKGSAVDGTVSYSPSSSNGVILSGDQWTITKRPGRQPYMHLRRQGKAPTFAVWYGQPGVEARLTRDSSQQSNVIFGRGTGYDRSAWLVMKYPERAQWATWAPIGYDSPNGVPLHHWDDWPVGQRERLYDGYDAEHERQNGIWVRERYWNSIPSGIEMDDGMKIAEQYIRRDKEIGWQGEVILKVDPLDLDGDPINKWQIAVGDVIWLKGFYGTDGVTPVRGTNVFHISQIRMNPQDGTVSLTVDTKFRDLLTVEESLLNSRDPLAPVKMLELGKSSVVVEDLAIPWNKKGGSGYVPQRFVDFPRSTGGFPWDTDMGNHPPLDYLDHDSPAYTGTDITYATRNWLVQGWKEGLTQHYTNADEAFWIPVNCGNPNPSYRWGFTPIVLSQAGSINGFEIAAYDINGNQIPMEFSVSFWSEASLTHTAMPYYIEGGGTYTYAALWKGAFSAINPDNGVQWPDDGAKIAHVGKAGELSIGWGTYEKPCGYTPGAKDQGTSCTGRFTDGAEWSYNFVDASMFGPSGTYASDINKDVSSVAFSQGIAIYAQLPSGTTPKWCFFAGQLHRQVQTGSN